MPADFCILSHVNVLYSELRVVELRKFGKIFLCILSFLNEELTKLRALYF